MTAGEPCLRAPTAEDAAAITRLIEASPPLDANSAYCNLLQCTDFAGTAVLAERAGRVVGWISAYRPPERPDELFVWQVAVSSEARGEGLASRMLDELIERPMARDASALSTTITMSNAGSWFLFESFAHRHRARLRRAPRFDRDRHFGGDHETEWEARIAPLPKRNTSNGVSDDLVPPT